MSKSGTNTASFIHDDFLLQSPVAKVLYHTYAKDLPILDYHCHLPPDDIATDRIFKNLTSIWLEGDHYKWRAMRTLGIDEHYITGKASDYEKFEKWAHTLPYTLRNPLYHWSHLELKRYFDVDQLLSPATARAIYDEVSNKLNQSNYSTRGLISKMNVELICTTDDPIDSLEQHATIKREGFACKILPAFRPDAAYAIENPVAYKSYLQKLSEVSGISINNYEQLLLALSKRIDYFQAAGCRLSDHGLEKIYFVKSGTVNAAHVFSKVLSGASLEAKEIESFKADILLQLGKLYHAKGWTQQFHLGALRNANSRLLSTLGPNTGFDSIGDYSQAENLSLFLNELDKTNQLTKTILYNLNPADNEVMATMIGNFNDGSIKGKIQYGSGWWFLDQKDGITKQLNALSNMSLLSCFIGMLTDSRSFLSFPRHEYFRRILCNMLGDDVVRGELPHDEKWLGKIVGDVCYYNAKEYLKF
ncbi:glucuronate isomerase [Chryseotalea sanaruensis]|uniref:Uronate isomerase n=1 Tax=Chryseotalea sanaruensis TaxID=2482724 RepID=A0A401U629_9BACT|nr:glucuronate isomerase [Chryseotalea sanaruensis]GCC50300.1 glucuronate isomerase [Chryseotalea sanaruensis]